MRISFSPKYREDELTVIKSGDVLTINGNGYDFSTLPEGATIPDGETGCPWIVGPVDRIEGELHITLMLPYTGNAEDIDESVTFPQPLINPSDGVLNIPRHVEPEVEDHADVEA